MYFKTIEKFYLLIIIVSCLCVKINVNNDYYKYNTSIISKNITENITEKININSINNRLIDDNNKERIFHGVNVVYKGYPWHPNMITFNSNNSFMEEDIEFIYNLGFNIIRLGLMWPGVEPYRNKFNYTYLDNLDKIIKNLAKKNIYVILDFHQDVLNEKFCGEGIPSWLVGLYYSFPFPISRPFNVTGNNNPTQKECDRHYWATYQFSYDASENYENFYNNDEIIERFLIFWQISINYLKSNKNILGYELINEPWAGNIFKRPWLIIPGFADYFNLENFYEKLYSNLKNLDPLRLFLYETVTWSIFKSGFSKLPGNNHVLSYHGYFFKDKEGPNFTVEQLFRARMKDFKKYNTSGILTEFNPTSKYLVDLLNHADHNKQSWITWNYKYFFNVTGDDSSFYYRNGSINNYTVKYLSRTYPQEVNGKIINYNYDMETKIFDLSYEPNLNKNRNQSSIIYLNKNLNYNKGFRLKLIPNNINFYYNDNRINIYHNKIDSDTKIINITLIPNNN